MNIFLEEAYGSRLIPILTQQEIDCLSLLIDRAVEIAPLTLHFDIGFIDSPGCADRTRIFLPHFFEDGNEALDPSQNVVCTTVTRRSAIRSHTSR